jgi:8-oxo-dGTP diphosphatase
MRDWVVGGAVIEVGALAPGDTARPGVVGGHPGGVLLVENLRHNGTSDWTPPGGVIDEGEVIVDGLTREVREETGLDVVSWSGLLYEIVAEAPGLGWRLRVEVHRALEVTGELRIGDDPDGIVVAADWVGATDCAARLHGAHPWVREPLLEWMTERFEVPRIFRYDVVGDRVSDVSVTRR